VIVLSKHFVASHWATFEFDMAHSRKKVILVIYGDLPSQETMGSSMWNYIQTNTYVRNDDPWFWQKLRYALPHRGGWSTRRMGYSVSLRRRRHDTDQVGTLINFIV
jgi:protein toll